MVLKKTVGFSDMSLMFAYIKLQILSSAASSNFKAFGEVIARKNFQFKIITGPKSDLPGPK